MALKHKRLQRAVEVTGADLRPVRRRRRGKGYVRFIRPGLVARGKAKIAEERRAKESERQKKALSEAQAAMRKAQMGSESEVIRGHLNQNADCLSDFSFLFIE